MKNLKELREQRAALLARAEALVALAREEKRELTDDEGKEYDGIIAEDTGQIAAVDREIVRGERLEELTKAAALEAAAKKRSASVPIPGDNGDPVVSTKIIVPASVNHYGKLTAYKTPEDAYSAGQWFFANFVGNEKSAQWCRNHGLTVRSALSGSTGANVLVPDVMENALIDLKETYGIARQLCDIYPMTSDNAIVPRRASGVTTYWVGDNTEITASDPGFDAVTLAAKKLAVLTLYSTEISEDAVIAIGDRITQECAYALAKKEDQCLIDGDGTSTYGGIVGLKTALAAGSEVTAPSGDIAFSDLILTTFESMIGKLPMYPGINPVWLISQAGWAASMMRLADAAGGNTTQNIMGGVGKSFLGYPVVISQACNSTLTDQASTEGLCFFGDLRMGVLFGNRRGVTFGFSSDRYFEKDQLAIKVTERFDINVHGAGDASNPGPIIQLLTPSA